jgi:hypothetical protein
MQAGVESGAEFGRKIGRHRWSVIPSRRAATFVLNPRLRLRHQQAFSPDGIGDAETGISTMDHPVNFTALAALRPGDARDDLSRALGAHWREPAPHQEGRVTALSKQQGFEAQIDMAGRIGTIRYRDPFPATPGVLGLHIGMPVTEALAALPQLVLSHRAPAYEAMYFIADLSNEAKLALEFRWQELYAISLRNPSAVYPYKQQMAYPAAAGAPGAPFGDPNFKLAVMSSLLESGALDLAAPEDLAAFVMKRAVDLEEDGYDMIREAYDYLVRYPLTDADLAKVETITFDGGNEIYPYCYYFWGGDGEEFDISSTAGIGLCGNLRQLTCIAMIERLDAAELAGLGKLETLELPSGCDNPELLLELPALKKLTFPEAAISDPALIAALKARGIAVRIDE